MKKKQYSVQSEKFPELQSSKSNLFTPRPIRPITECGLKTKLTISIQQKNTKYNSIRKLTCNSSVKIQPFISRPITE
uniref:Uncharacterized protein n=1 Tax=Rhizophora mucronata TaxID=61149 RepID=A0A2P2N466_RHIMU